MARTIFWASLALTPVVLVTHYALALGGPLVVLIGLIWLAARTIRRRREDALLNRA